MRLVQCWDDGITDDIRLIEILRAHGAKASFNLNFGLHGDTRGEGWSFRGLKQVWRLAKPELREVYNGFTIANHTSTHPHLESIPLQDAQTQIREGKDALEQHFGVEVKGFAYPFGTYNPEVQNVLREAGHVYARTTQKVANAYPPADATAFHPNCHFLAPDFWERFEQVRAVDGVFYFWGHSYELVSEDDWQNFDAQIARLSATEGAQWFDLPTLFET
jgi:peptidoglycan-N-acetylglucosamine deacetylase